MIRIYQGEVRGPGLAEKSGWMQLDFIFREHMHLFKGAKLAVFLNLVLHSDEHYTCFPSYKTIAKETGYSVPTIAEAMSDLLETRLEGVPVLAWFNTSKDKERSANLYVIFPTVEELTAIQNRTLIVKMPAGAVLSSDPMTEPFIDPDDPTKKSLVPPEVLKKVKYPTKEILVPPTKETLVEEEPLLKPEPINQNHLSSSLAEKTNVPAVEDDRKRQPQRKGDLLDGMLFYSRQAAGPLAAVAHFPPNIQGVLAEFVNLWGVTPPDPKTRGDKGRFAEWILEGEALLAACGEVGVEAIRRVKAENQMRGYPGRPGTLITWARTAAAKIRMERGQAAEAAAAEAARLAKKEAERAALDAAAIRMYPQSAGYFEKRA